MKQILLSKKELIINSKLGKSFGIAALVLAIAAIFVPVVSLYFIWITLVLIAIAVFLENKKDKEGKILTRAAFIICLVNAFLLSPSTWMAFSGERLQGQHSLLMTTIVFFAIPYLVTIQNSMKKEKN